VKQRDILYWLKNINWLKRNNYGMTPSCVTNNNIYICNNRILVRCLLYYINEQSFSITHIINLQRKSGFPYAIIYNFINYYTYTFMTRMLTIFVYVSTWYVICAQYAYNSPPPKKKATSRKKIKWTIPEPILLVIHF